MNFTEFQSKVKQMEQELQEAGVNPKNVKMEYTKLDGNHCLWAMVGDKIISYFKW